MEVEILSLQLKKISNIFLPLMFISLKQALLSWTIKKGNMTLVLFSIQVLPWVLCILLTWIWELKGLLVLSMLQREIPIYKKIKYYWKANISWSILVLIWINISSCQEALDILLILRQYFLGFIIHQICVPQKSVLSV